MPDSSEFTDAVYNNSVCAVVDNKSVLKFLLSGNCYCNIENLKTGNCFTYKIKRNKEKNLSHMYFVYVESGLGDIYAGYFYVNATLFDYRKGDKGKLTEEDIRIKVLLYVLNHAPNLPPNVIVEHKGRCGNCGIPLTELDEIRKGLCSLCDSTLKDR